MIYVSCVNKIEVAVPMEESQHFEDMLDFYKVTYGSKRENKREQETIGVNAKMIYTDVRAIPHSGWTNDWRRFCLWLNESRILMSVKELPEY